MSQHLKVLKNANLVTETAQGTRRIYRADPEGLAELRRYLENFWGDALSAYAAAAESPGTREKKGKTDVRRKR